MQPFFAPLADIIILGQQFEWPDLLIVGLLVLLEGVLSIDNALVLGLLAKRLPKDMRARALSYGLVGAFVFRVIAILTASYLLQWTFVKLIGGGYLIFIAVKHLLFEHKEDIENKVVLDEQGQPYLIDAATGGSLNDDRVIAEIEQRVPIGASMVTDEMLIPASETSSQQLPEGKTCNVIERTKGAFWRTVIVIELTDIAFAVDSILAAMALAGSTREKLWVVIAGGILGVVLMRFAAAVFIKLLDRFPRFEVSAYLLVIVIGTKLVFDWGFNSDWSFKQSPWLAKSLGSWQSTMEDVEIKRRSLVTSYEGWLRTSWPIGIAPAHHHSAEGITKDEPQSSHSSDKEKHELPNKSVPKSDTTSTETATDSTTPAPSTDVAKPPFVPHLLDFHDVRRPESIVFWVVMLFCFLSGFLPKRKS